MADRLPPHSKESESCLLGCMLFDNSCIPKILDRITDDSFYIDSYRLFYRAIKQTYLKLKKVDLVLLKDNVDPKEYEAAGGADKSVEIVEGVPNAANWEAYLKTVLEKQELRRYLSASTSAVDGIYSGELGTAELAGIFKQALFANGVRRENAYDAAVSGANAIDWLTKTRAGGVDLGTGWNQIDADLGGLRRKELTVFGAKMSNCKTSVAINVMCNLLVSNPNQKVLINAFENIDQVPTRAASIISQTPLEWFVKPHLCNEEQHRQTIEAVGVWQGFKDRVIVMNSASLLDMRSVCDEFHPDLIILDYLQKYGQRYCTGAEGLYAHEIGRVASEVQDLAKDFNSHSILLSQLARRMQGDRNRPPEVPDLKESGDIENCADNILLGWWPWRDQPESGKDPADYYVFIGKNKMGPCEKRLLRIDVRTLTIGDYGT